jgi:predicted Ser/Thr protein kinase
VLRERSGMTALLEAHGLDRRANVEARAILHQSDRSMVYRCHVSNLGRMVICKEPRGPAAAARLLHERRVLERLAGIEGIPALVAAGDARANRIAGKFLGRRLR